MIATDSRQGWLGASAMSALIGAHDWSATPLGRIDAWPAGLRTALGICLGSGAPLGVCWGSDLRVFYNDAWRMIFGDRHPAVLGAPAREMFHDIWDAIGPRLDAVADRGETSAVRAPRTASSNPVAHPDCAIDFTLAPIPDDAHDIRGVLIIAHETTEHAIVAELQHRTRNLLAFVRAIAAQTFTRHGGHASFLERLASLARVQGLLARADGERVRLVDLIRAEIEPRATVHASRIEIHGADVRLSAHQLQTIALAVHELTTNAVNHGALRTPHGKLSATWETWSAGPGRPRLALTWKESGVAMPTDAGSRRGQGRELIEHALRFSLRAHTQLVFGADGVWCRIELPL